MVIKDTSLIDVLSFLKQNSYPSKEKVPTVKKKPLRLVLPDLGNLSLQTRTKLQKSIKRVLKCCKLHVVFESPKNL